MPTSPMGGPWPRWPVLSCPKRCQRWQGRWLRVPGWASTSSSRTRPGTPQWTEPPRFVKLLARELADSGWCGPLLVSSFDLDTIDAVRTELEEVGTGFLISRVRSVPDLLGRTRDGGHVAINPSDHLVDEAFVTRRPRAPTRRERLDGRFDHSAFASSSIGAWMPSSRTSSISLGGRWTRLERWVQGITSCSAASVVPIATFVLLARNSPSA